MATIKPTDSTALVGNVCSAAASTDHPSAATITIIKTVEPPADGAAVNW